MFQKLTGEAGGASLNALRAFEAMARTGRATLAAAELGVTHSAVSRQVKALERRLGVRLFEGPRHALRLTAEGQALAAELGPAFAAVNAAVRRVRGRAAGLTLAVHPSLASKWLIPRLKGFKTSHPQVRVDLLELSTDGFTHDGADAVLRLVRGERTDMVGLTVLVANCVGPVAAPSLPELMCAPRLVSRTHLDGWRRWAEAAGEPLPSTPEIAFSHLHLALEAAVGGLGVAVLPWLLVADDIIAGRLAPVGPFVADDGVLALIAAPGVEHHAFRLFRTWLRAEAEVTAALA